MPLTRKQRKTNPVVFVFCEGETEQRYVDALRSEFRVPIQIVTKVLNTKISQRMIDTHIRACGYPNIDKVFLLYDGDRQDVVDKILGINNAYAMLSYPCIELWFILHFTEHKGYIDSDTAVKKMKNLFPAYKKGEMPMPLTRILMNSWKLAATRAKCLTSNTNPSSTAYMLPEYLELIKM